MSSRERLYSSLIKELPSPKGSVDETFVDDPRDEYVTRVLEPQSSPGRSTRL